MLQFVYVAAVSFLLPQLCCLMFSLGAALQHCSSVSQILAFTCKVARSSFIQLPSASKCCWFIFFSFHGPKYPAFSVLLLTVLQPQATDIYQSKSQVRYLQDWEAAQYSEGKPERFPPQMCHLVLAIVTASDRQKAQSTARLLWVSPITCVSYTPCLDFPPLASQDKAGFCSPAHNWF